MRPPSLIPFRSGSGADVRLSVVALQRIAKMATAVEHAGFTEVLVTGIETRWMSVRQRPMARGPNPAGASLSVAPQMTRRKMQVVTISVTAQARKP